MLAAAAQASRSKCSLGTVWIVSMERRVMQMVRRLFAYAGMLIFGFVPRAALAQHSPKLPYMNPELSPEERATDLVHRMTLAQKASQIGGQPETGAPSVSGHLHIDGQYALPE